MIGDAFSHGRLQPYLDKLIVINAPHPAMFGKLMDSDCPHDDGPGERQGHPARNEHRPGRAHAGGLLPHHARQLGPRGIVADKATAEAPKAYYNVNCKRPTIHDEYLHAFN
jgi:hypothetical protein